MKKLFITFFAMGLLLALCGMAQAYSWNVDSDFSFFDGTTNQHVLSDGTKIESTGGNLKYDFEHGWGTLGVSPTVPSAQINTNESIKFTFAKAQYIDNLAISQIYMQNSYYYDNGNEIAQITGMSGGTEYTYTLTITGPTSYAWTGMGSVINLDPSQEHDGGVWQLLNPFGNLAIDSIILTALDNGGGDTFYNSDFGFYAMETTPTPIPGAVWLLGTGLFGLVGLRRKFRG